MAQDNRAERKRSKYRRRRVIQIVGGGTIGGLAGCLGGDGDGSDDGGGTGNNGSDGGSGNLVDDSLTFAGGGAKVQFNPFNVTNYHDGLVLYDRLGRYNHVKDEFIKIMADSWSKEGETLSLTIKENYSWSDGSDITADDVVTRFRLGEYFGERVWDFAESVEKTGDYSVEFSLSGEVNEQVLLLSLLYTKINTPATIYEEHLQKLDQAGSEEEENSAISDLTEFTVSDPLASGPYKWGRAEGSTWIYEKNEHHPSSDELNIPQLDFTGGGSGKSENALLSADEVDATIQIFIPPKVAENLPEHMQLVFAPPVSGMGVYFNHNDEVFGDWRVRKALAYAVDCTELAKAANNYGGEDLPQIKPLPEDLPNAGILPMFAEDYLGDSLDQFETAYVQEVDLDKATQLLEDAGYTKENGTWVDDSGSPVTIPYKNAVQAQDRVPMGESAVSQWEEFGFNTEHVTVEGSTFWGQTVPNGDYRVTTWDWGGSNFHPYFAFWLDFSSPSRLQSHHFPSSEIEVPWPIGNVEGWDETETLNLQEMTAELVQTPAGSDREIELTRQLAWAWNQTVPCIQTCVGQFPQILSDDDWNLPSSDTDVMQFDNPHEILLRPHIEGMPHMSAKTE